MRGLSLHHATVDAPDGSKWTECTVSSRRGTLVIKQGRGRAAETLATSTTVTAVAHVSRKLWGVTTAEGTYLVLDTGCGCS